MKGKEKNGVDSLGNERNEVTEGKNRRNKVDMKGCNTEAEMETKPLEN